MSNWIGLGIFALVILAALYGLYHLSKPYDVSAEEFEKRAREGPGLISAGMIGLQKMLEPGAKKAIEAQEDLRRGRYNKEDGSGEPPEPGQETMNKIEPEIGDQANELLKRRT
jgi:hypothetical protein